MKTPKIGAHVSAAGGLSETLKRGLSIGAECLQIFAGSPRRYEVGEISYEEGLEYQCQAEKMKLFPIYIHASYLLNLASEEDLLVQKSKKNLIDNLIYSSKIGSRGVVYHPGSPKGGSKEDAIKREIEGIKDILSQTPKNSFLIVENTAGEKKIGTDPEEIGIIFKEVGSKRLKVCIDTAHSLESGNIIEFSKKGIKDWITWWGKDVGLENIELFHINDSLTKPGSRHDRHANIGEGYIGLKGFKELMNFQEINHIPWVLEVPGFDGGGPDKKNIDILRGTRGDF
jgi:deoxyribonuclease IV